MYQERMYALLTCCVILVFLNPVSSVNCYIGVGNTTSSLKDCGATSNKCVRVRYLGLDSRLCFSDLIKTSPAEGFLPTSGCKMIDTDSFPMQVCVCAGDGCNADPLLQELKTTSPSTAASNIGSTSTKTGRVEGETTTIIPAKSAPTSITMASMTHHTKLITQSDHSPVSSTGKQVDTAVEITTAPVNTITMASTITATKADELPSATVSIAREYTQLATDESPTSPIEEDSLKSTTVPDGLASVSDVMKSTTAFTKLVTHDYTSTASAKNTATMKLTTESPLTSAIFVKSQTPIILSRKTDSTTPTRIVTNWPDVAFAIVIFVLLCGIMATCGAIARHCARTFAVRKNYRARSISTNV